MRLLGRVLAYMVAVLAIFVNSNLLTWLGIPFDLEGGSALVKLHPAALLCYVSFACSMTQTHMKVATRQPLVLVSLTCFIICLLVEAMATGFKNLTILINNFVSAGLLATVFVGFDTVQRSALRRVLQVSIVASVVIALGESALHTTLLPFYLDGLPYQPRDGDFRPIALYDHPLTGATVSLIGAFIPPQTRLLRAVYLILMALGLIVFGSRAALAVIALCVLGRCAAAACPAFMAARVPARTLRLAAGAILLGLAACLAAYEAGLAERLDNHFVWDASAEVRVLQWRILALLDAQQMLFGVSRQDVIALLEPMRLAYGVPTIENFWLFLFLNLGLFGFPFFVLGLTALLLWCVKQSDGHALLMVVAALAVASTSASLGHKSPLLIIVVVAAFALPKASAARQTLHRHHGGFPAGHLLPRVGKARSVGLPSLAVHAGYSSEP